MKFSIYKNFFYIIYFFIHTTLLNISNNIILMNPKGQIGLYQKSLILTSLGLMLIIVIPVIIMTFVFIFKYRYSNNNSIYSPNWAHSNKIEIFIWTIPIIIILFLANLTLKSTHYLDPKKPIYSNINPLNIEVIALDWKWLFIYPKEGIATLNEVVFPTNVPLIFHITSNSVMNSFFIPQLGGQIYAMAGMNSTLNLIANEPGIYKGFSSNFSGYGFSGMKFIAIATKNSNNFNLWIKTVKNSPKVICNINDYNNIAHPSKFNKIEYFSKIKNNLFKIIINKFKVDNKKKTNEKE